MDERYTRLFSLPENLYTTGSPILIAAGALLKDNSTGNVLAQVKFKNISAKTIQAVKVSLQAFDISGTALHGIDEHQYLDLSVARDAEFGQKVAIPLPDAVTRSFSCVCRSVIFADSTAWEAGGDAAWQPIAKPETLREKLGSLAAQYRRDTTIQAKFITTDDRDLWICACGAINRQNEASCHTCRSERTALLAAMDTEALQQRHTAHEQAEAKRRSEEAERQAERQAERRREEAERASAKRKKLIRTGIFSGAAAALAAGIVLVITLVIVPASRYGAAIELMNAGNYGRAQAAFEYLGDYQDAQEKAMECLYAARYQYAMALMDAGSYEDARAAFAEIGDYQDAKEKAAECEQLK